MSDVQAIVGHFTKPKWRTNKHSGIFFNPLKRKLEEFAVL